MLLIGTEAEVKVAYRGIGEKTTLCCDLHCQKTDGSSGFYSNDWRPHPPVQGQGQMTFRIPIREAADVASAMLVIFTAPEGQWAKHSRLVYSRPIPLVDPDPGYSKSLKEVNYNRSRLAVDWSPLAALVRRCCASEPCRGVSSARGTLRPEQRSLGAKRPGWPGGVCLDPE